MPSRVRDGRTRVGTSEARSWLRNYTLTQSAARRRFEESWSSCSPTYRAGPDSTLHKGWRFNHDGPLASIPP